MTYNELLAKLKKGEAFTDTDVEEFSKLTRPAERFNEVSLAKNKLEDTIKELNGKVSMLEAEKITLAQTAEDTFNTKFKELSGTLEAITGENNTLKQYKAQMDKLQAVQRIATADCKEYVDGATFKDPEYLANLLDRRGVDINDKEKVKEAMLAIKAEKPEQFIVPITPGSGTGATPQNATPTPTRTFKSSEERAAYVAEHGYDAYSKVKGD